MNQQTFADIEYSNRKKKTRREEFLNTMDKLIPWEEWIEMVRPYYPEGKRGRPPRGIETMLRMYLLQKWFGLSDAAAEDAIYDSYSMRSFMHLDFFKEQVPGAATLAKFRRVLEVQGIAGKIDSDIAKCLKAGGFILRRIPGSTAVVVRR